MSKYLIKNRVDGKNKSIICSIYYYIPNLIYEAKKLNIFEKLLHSERIYKTDRKLYRNYISFRYEKYRFELFSG